MFDSINFLTLVLKLHFDSAYRTAFFNGDPLAIKEAKNYVGEIEIATIQSNFSSFSLLASKLAKRFFPTVKQYSFSFSAIFLTLYFSTDLSGACAEEHRYRVQGIRPIFDFATEELANQKRTIESLAPSQEVAQKEVFVNFCVLVNSLQPAIRKNPSWIASWSSLVQLKETIEKKCGLHLEAQILTNGVSDFDFQGSSVDMYLSPLILLFTGMDIQDKQKLGNDSFSLHIEFSSGGWIKGISSSEPTIEKYRTRISELISEWHFFEFAKKTPPTLDLKYIYRRKHHSIQPGSGRSSSRR